MAFRGQGTPVVQLALSIASVTYGSLLGTYILGGIWPRATERDAVWAIAIGALVMTPVVLGAVVPGFPVSWRWLPGLAWLWYVPLRTAVTVRTGILTSTLPHAAQSA